MRLIKRIQVAALRLETVQAEQPLLAGAAQVLPRLEDEIAQNQAEHDGHQGQLGFAHFFLRGCELR